MSTRTTRTGCSFVVAVSAVAACGDSPAEVLLPPLAQLPADLVAVTFDTHGRTTWPYTMLELRQPDGFRGFVTINDAGAVVWYFRTEGSPLSFTRRANGNFVLLDTERGLVEVTPRGAVVRELAQQARPGRRIHHDVMATAHNTIVFIAEQWQPHGGEPVNGEAIWEWHPETGAVHQRWNAFDHLVPALDWGPRSRNDDWLHANSIAPGPSGTILLSLHFLDQVLAIAPDFTRIVWRMGGTNASVPVDDAFSGQHTAQKVGIGRVLLFDNGFARDVERYSRAVEYDVTGSMAKKAWEWRPARDNWARVISGARRLPNGNTMVAFGTPANMPVGATGPIEVYEVTAAGDVAWHLLVGGAVSSMYRATPIAAF